MVGRDALYTRWLVVVDGMFVLCQRRESLQHWPWIRPLPNSQLRQTRFLSIVVSYRMDIFNAAGLVFYHRTVAL